MKIMLSGGGTGGHITPIVTVASKLKKSSDDIKTVYVGERRSRFGHLTENNAVFTSRYQIFSGKLRRYHDETLSSHFKDIRTILLNVRDSVYVLIGVMQSVYIVRKEKPDVVFLKGGYVGVPIGLAAAFWRIPIVTHDSDAVAGLANRIVQRWTSVHAVALEPDNYPYNIEKVVQVGIVVDDTFKYVNTKMQRQYKKELGYKDSDTVLLVTCGSSGSQFVNRLIERAAPTLLENNSSLHIIHQVGGSAQDVYQRFTHPRLKIITFIDKLHVWSGAADVIVMRAGANTLAEFGAQAKPCIVIPGPQLAGGHQIANAQYLKEQGAIICLNQEAIGVDGFIETVESVVASKKLQQSLSRSFHATIKPNAAEELAAILVQIAKDAQI